MITPLERRVAAAPADTKTLVIVGDPQVATLPQGLLMPGSGRKRRVLAAAEVVLGGLA